MDSERFGQYLDDLIEIFGMLPGKHEALGYSAVGTKDRSSKGTIGSVLETLNSARDEYNAWQQKGQNGQVLEFEKPQLTVHGFDAKPKNFTFLYVRELVTYIDDVIGVLKHASTQAEFVGAKTVDYLESSAKLLDGMANEIDQYQRGPSSQCKSAGIRIAGRDHPTIRLVPNQNN